MGAVAWLLVAGCVLLETAEQVCYRLAGRRRRWRYAAVVAPGVAAHVIRMALWLLVLKVMPLGVAFPLMGANYLAIALASRLLFKERLGPRRWVGTALIVVGFVLVAAHGRGN